MLRFAVAISVVLSCGGWAAGHLQSRPQKAPEHALDLLVLPNDPEDSPSDRDLRRWLTAPVADGSTRTEFPFQATLSATDRSEYALRDTIIFTVLLKNTSVQAVQFPWLPQARSVNPRMRGSRAFMVHLHFTDPILGQQDFGFRQLYGSEEVPGSLRLIQPGETLEVRSAAHAVLSRAWEGTGDTPTVRDVHLKANLVLAVKGQFVPPTTTNEINVRLRLK